MKNIIKYALFVVVVFLISCDDREKDLYSDIRVGKEAFTAVTLNQESTRNIVLTGGNGKYSVNVQDSKIAKAEVSNDTLKITGLSNGETFAMITSHDKRMKLGIKVVDPQIIVSQDEVRLYPSETRSIVLSGGGDIVDIEKNDPDNIMEVQLNGETKMIEIRAIYEGEATIYAKTATSTQGAPIKVIIKSNGDTSERGLYMTTHQNVFTEIRNVMVAYRKGKGVWLAGSTRPHGYFVEHENFNNHRKAMHISSVVNPKVGEYVDVEIQSKPEKHINEKVKSGSYKLHIDEVREKDVVLRGKGFRLVIPYEK